MANQIAHSVRDGVITVAEDVSGMVGMARPVTKWATRVVDPASLLRVLRRAV